MWGALHRDLKLGTAWQSVVRSSPSSGRRSLYLVAHRALESRKQSQPLVVLELGSTVRSLVPERKPFLAIADAGSENCHSQRSLSSAMPHTITQHGADEV